MRRIIFFCILFLGGLFYILLAYVNLCIELQNIQLREKRMLLERDGKLLALEIARSTSLKNLEGYAGLIEAKAIPQRQSIMISEGREESVADSLFVHKETIPLIISLDGVSALTSTRRDGPKVDTSGENGNAKD